ncbi:MAG TPA: aminotransferase class V-fold PLP-dependent enzyme, partial [Pseudomonas nitrititolerans]|nr:aminotransferase class V-fold PLP-dependent enzyme [Stutzerimonas nitrititolerans]
IAIRSGTHCAQPLMKSLGVDGAIRVSLGLYNDGTDLERFFAALDQSLELLQ